MARQTFLRGVLASALLLAIAGFAHADELGDARAAYRQRDYATAFKLWRPLADKRNAEAETWLGVLYEEGLAVGKDEQMAHSLMRKAAAQDYPEAICFLGERYVSGWHGTPHDVDQGLALMRTASEKGDVKCQYELGDFYRSGLFGVRVDLAEAARWYQKSADAGYVLAEGRLATAYQFGLGVEKNVERANYWYLKAHQQNLDAAMNGDVAAQLSLGMSYELGRGPIARDRKQALYWYKMGAARSGPLQDMAKMDVTRVEKNLASQQ